MSILATESRDLFGTSNKINGINGGEGFISPKQLPPKSKRCANPFASSLKREKRFRLRSIYREGTMKVVGIFIFCLSFGLIATEHADFDEDSAYRLLEKGECCNFCFSFSGFATFIFNLKNMELQNK
jgi:hypothetical protein